MTARELIKENGYEDIVIFENPSYDSALIGISEDNRAIYDYDKMIEFLMSEDDLSYEDAADMISYNTVRSLQYTPNSPIILYPLIDFDKVGGEEN